MTINPPDIKDPEAHQIGRRLNRLESRAKVTGRAEYTHNIVLPRMLHVKIVRSTIAHGKLLEIDTSAARAMPGVFAVYTGADVQALIPQPYYGPAFHDQPVLAIGKVVHVGEPVAVVLASDPHVAESACHLVKVVYDPLPAVFDEVEAATSSILVHDELKPAGTFPDLKHLVGRKGTNVALDFHVRSGDVDAEFARAAHVFENTFKTQQIMHGDSGGPGLERQLAHAVHGLAKPVLRAHRNRPPARLAREPGQGPDRNPGWRLRRQALHQARGPGRCLRPAGAASGARGADDGRTVLHHHQARHHVPDQERGQ
jgi:xanthine dehydrogenase molybdopterin-binding subunit B